MVCKKINMANRLNLAQAANPAVMLSETPVAPAGARAYRGRTKLKFWAERFSSFLTSHINARFLFGSLPLFLLGLFTLWNLSSWPMRLQYPGDGSYGGDAIPLAELLHLRQGLPIHAAASGAEVLISRPFDFEAKTVPLAVTENDHF